MMKKAISAYGQASIDLVVESASPHQLIVMLYEGAIKSVVTARFQMEQGKIAEKGAAISKAIAIIDDGLRLALDHEQGGELVENLDRLYEYLSFQLLNANINNDVDALSHVVALLTQLKEAWQSIGPNQLNSEALATTENNEALRDAASYGKA
ncbi:flagellar export chaperone FliS [uncultured Deefgea sp.]|uniref:flagellar export chaperone FliS n=1 Tax=uncultured Deefgea sp. TaxID=1304914 RepID=UPI002623D3A5|nr:flagellar export chaperone FliS [uncultured Deefgea sp.]